MDKTLIVTEIERSAIHDGPGLRTVVFLQGCPLHCFWCCNPETQSPTPVLLHDAKLCVGCGSCARFCTQKAVSVSDGTSLIDRSRCRSCGTCAAVCPVGANKLSGHAMPIDEILKIVMRDTDYYKATGGGLTLSGGEPLLQPAAAELLSQAKENGISTYVETTAFLPWEKMEPAVRLLDGLYVDYKHPEAEALKRATGAVLETIDRNLHTLASVGANFTMRTPVIPGFNDREDVLRECFSTASDLGRSEYVLLPYHSLGAAKYKKLGNDAPLPGVSPMKPEELAKYAEIGREYGLRIKIGG